MNCVNALLQSGKLSTSASLTQPYASGESVFLLVWKPKGDICLNKSGLVVVLHKRHVGYWNTCQNIWEQNAVICWFFGTRWISLVFSVIRVSQGSVATYVRCGGMSTSRCTANFLLSLSVEEFLKSVKIWQSYCQKFRGLVFLEHGVYMMYLTWKLRQLNNIIYIIIIIIQHLYSAMESEDTEAQ